jgi:hypothetical protein
MAGKVSDLVHAASLSFEAHRSVDGVPFSLAELQPRNFLSTCDSELEGLVRSRNLVFGSQTPQYCLPSTVAEPFWDVV